jgi:Tol biopolymer transport system component/DNA-binding winged helix-turn-helix (wHTH) protein
MAIFHHYVFGEFRLDAEQRALFRRGELVALAPKSLETLLFLVERHGRIVEKRELLDAVWPDTFVEEANLPQNIFTLRKVLGDGEEGHSFIETVPKRGYRFVAPVQLGADSLPDSPLVPSAQLPAPSPAQMAAAFKTESPAHELPREGSRTGIHFSAGLLGLLAGLLLATGFASWLILHRQPLPVPARMVTFQRLTNFVGLKEFPAISPDGKTVAFTADKTGRRQVWVRLIAGGTPLQITQDNSEHMYPRWLPDSSALVYYSPPLEGEEQGTLWEVPAFGGSPHRLTSSISSADASHDGSRLAFFRLNERKQVELVSSRRDTSAIRVLAELPASEAYEYPRWSPDDRSIAFQRSTLYVDDIAYVPAQGGQVRPITREGVFMEGFSWLADGSGIIYSSGRESTVLYLPTMHLWFAPLDGSAPRQLTYGETSLLSPDVDGTGRVVASRLRLQFDIWKYPVAGSASENVRNAQRLTHQTGQVQTPSAAPGDRELAYLSDEGGHGNIWVLDLSSGATRQITAERNARVTVGLPVWSPMANRIAFVSSRDQPDWETLGLWLVQPDGSELRQLVDRIAGYPTWSSDGKWVYYSTRKEDVFQLYKISATGGPQILVRTDNACVAALGPDGSTLYYVVPHLNGNGIRDYEIRVANPEMGPSRRLAQINGNRVAHWQILQPTLSHDGRWLALLLNDGGSTNLYVLGAGDGAPHALTDFGGRRTLIVRRVSWSSDDRFLYAAVGDGDADIVQIEGILP